MAQGSSGVRLSPIDPTSRIRLERPFDAILLGVSSIQIPWTIPIVYMEGLKSTHQYLRSTPARPSPPAHGSPDSDELGGDSTVVASSHLSSTSESRVKESNEERESLQSADRADGAPHEKL